MTAAGFHVHIHALSDRGVRAAIDAFSEVKQEADAKNLTQSITHVQLAHPDDIKRIGDWVSTSRLPMSGYFRTLNTMEADGVVHAECRSTYQYS